MIKYIKKLMLVILLAVNLGSQADDSIKDKVNCAADAIVFNLMFADKDNPDIPPQKERIAVWSNAITNKLIELGNSSVEAKNILRDAVKKSREELAAITSEQKEEFDNWWLKATRCIKKHSK
jgi:hypothetical protein